MRQWILLIVIVLATAGYVYQTQFAGGKKARAAAAAATPSPTPSPSPNTADPAAVGRIQAFLGQAKLRSTLLGPPDIAIIDGREVAEGGRLQAGPGLDLEVRDVGDGFVTLAYKDQTFRLDKVAPPPPSPVKR